MWMVLRGGIWLGLCVALGSSVIGCEALRELQITGGGVEYWEPEIDGFVEAKASGTNSTKTDYDGVLGLDDEAVLNFRAGVRLVAIDMEFEYFEFDSDGQRVSDSPVVFNGTTFPTGTALDSDMEFSMLTGHVRIPFGPAGPFSLSGIVGVHRLEVETEIQGGGQQSNDGFEAYFPVAGFHGAFDFPMGESASIFVEGEVATFLFDLFEVDGTYVDTDIRGGLKFDFIRIGGGYRWLDIDLEENRQSEIDLRLRGPFLFGELVF